MTIAKLEISPPTKGEFKYEKRQHEQSVFKRWKAPLKKQLSILPLDSKFHDIKNYLRIA